MVAMDSKAASDPLPSPSRLATGIGHIGQIAGAELAETLPRLLFGLPDAVAAVNLLDRFLRVAPASLLSLLRRDLSLLQSVLLLFSHSQFLAESLIQAPEQLLWLQEARRVDRVRSRDELATELAAFTAPALPEERPLALIRFKRREYLRIVLRDLLGLSTLAETTQELSHLADALLGQAYIWAWNDLITRFGTPVALRDGQETVAEMAVIGLGKLGGEELNYSSDIDLMFVYSDEGETDGRAGPGGATTNREFFIRMAQEITRCISRVTHEGAAYRVDLRLRPGGSSGDVAVSLRHALRYYGGEARDWEWQMLIRARHCAGSLEVARAFFHRIESFVYRPGHGPEALRSVLEARERITAQLERHRAGARRSPALDVKLDPGGIRDIEFLVQGLQRLHGGDDAWLRTGNTLIAMQRLHDKNYLSGPEMQQLASAHWLLRNVEHRLQLHLGQQTHSLPETGERMDALALSLLIAEGGRRNATWLAAYQSDPETEAHAGVRLLHEIQSQMAQVRALYEAKIAPLPQAPAEDAATAEATEDSAVRTLSRHAQQNLRRWQNVIAANLEPAVPPVPASRRGRKRLVRLLDRSDFLTETLLRRPTLAACLDQPELEQDEVPVTNGDLHRQMAALRRWYQQQVFCRIADELEHPRPIRQALRGLSRLADQALEQAVRIAAAGVQGQPVASPGLAILALGRLGLEEFDILSDVDLIFLAPEPELEAAHRMAARVIDVVTAYMQDGMLFAIDTRLRPGGGEGELVQSPAAVQQHFRERGSAWEAVSYLKARPVAGDRTLAADALARWRPVLEDRFGDAARLRPDLREMRQRIEAEPRPGRRGVKTGKGGYYDVDFIISSRVLEHRGINLDGMGLAEIALRLGESGLLHQDGARRLADGVTLLRAADHAIRIVMGKSPLTPPESGHAAEAAHALLERSLGRRIDRSISEAMQAARNDIRAVYDDELSG